MNHTPIPTLDQIINAPADQWRALAQLADADPGYIERERARIEAQRQEGQPSRPSRKRRRSSASNGTIRRNWRASQVIAQAMAEAVDRANESEDGHE